MLKLAILFGATFAAVNGVSRIIGGEDTEITQHPYQISLQTRGGQHFCGGFLISKTWAVTAAHCLSSINPVTIRTYKIRAGSSLYNQGGQVIKIRSSKSHFGFSLDTLDNDIALLKLASSVNIAKAKAAKMPNQNVAIPDNTKVTVTGWGWTDMVNNTSPIHLQAVEVPTINRTVCKSLYEPTTHKVTDNMFCAGLLGIGGKDACGGDSGGPAAVGGEVVGLVSWGMDCAHPDFPGVYTQLSRYRNWIRQNARV